MLMTLYAALAIGIISLNQNGISFSQPAPFVVVQNRQESENSTSAPKQTSNSTEVNGEKKAEKEEAQVTKAPEPLGNIHIQASLLNVRETPNGTIIGKVGFGETYDYYEKQNKWLKIDYEGKAGYIFGDYGDIYDTEGTLVAAANIPQPEPVQPQPAEEAPAQSQPQEAEPTQPQPAPQKSPQDMSTQELCQWVLAQIITPDMDDFAKVRAVNQYLCDHMTYDLQYYTTRDAILIGRGRCQGYTNAFKNLMNTLGIPTDYVRGYVDNDRSSTHAWNRVLIGGNYYYVDVTWNDSTGANTYLLLGEEEFNCGRTIIEYNPRSE